MSTPIISRITCEHLSNLESSNEAKEHVILDIRDHAEFDAGHILDSIHVPHRELETNIASLIPEKSKRVIVIVGPTHEPEIETIHEKLSNLGYSNVEFLAGGFDQYCEIAPVEIEPDLLLKTPEEDGAVGDDLAVIDPEGKDNEPLF